MLFAAGGGCSLVRGWSDLEGPPLVAGPDAAPDGGDTGAAPDCTNVDQARLVACGSPCLDPSGKAVDAVERFSEAMWGCPGKVPFTGRAALCKAGFSPCAASTWTTFARSRKVPPRHAYWVREELFGHLGPNDSCWVDVDATSSRACASGLAFGVCQGAGSDSDGNTCEDYECAGDANNNANDFFGGCLVPGAGVLCCSGS